MKFGIMGNQQKPQLAEVSRRLFQLLRAKNIPYCVEESLARWLVVRDTDLMIGQGDYIDPDVLPSKCDVVIALGGDGTILSAARLIGRRGTPILGINLGKLGFMAEASVDDLESAITELLRNETRIDERMVLMVEAEHTQKKFYALNDIVIDRGLSPRVLNLQANVNSEHLFTLAADGLILTTPTGSTAYSLASGGPIITPDSKVIAITPISPHTLTARAVVVPETSVVRIVVETAVKPVHLIADGQGEDFFQPPVAFSVRKADYTIKLVKRKKQSYFDLLRTKLLWGHDVRLAKEPPHGKN